MIVICSLRLGSKENESDIIFGSGSMVLKLLKVKVQLIYDNEEINALFVYLNNNEQALELFNKLGKQLIPYGKVERSKK